MEKTPPDPELTAHDDVKNLLVGNNGEEEPANSSNSSVVKVGSDASDKSKDENQNSQTVSAKTPPPSTSRNSPDPCCAICLEKLQNKSYTNSCLHMFCFKCLVEWSKIKAECPLCKQQFKSIIHNVQEDFQYDTYYIKPTKTFFEEIALRFASSRRSTIQRQPRRRTSRLRGYATDRILMRSTIIEEHALRLQIENHRRRYAPHSVSVVSTSQTTRSMPSIFRRNIYEQNLWVKPVSLDRFRLASPDFFRYNPACTHRLLPWLNRELIVLLHNVENQIVFVLELIMSLITRYEITSDEFFNHIEPYLLQNTRHFIHEFYNFASSPFDMEVYDQHAVYEPLSESNINHNDDVSSSTDVITLDNEETPSNETSATDNSHPKQTRKGQKRKAANKKTCAEKLVLKRNRETNSWVSSWSLPHDFPGTGYYSNPGPSTSTDLSSTSIDIFDRSTTPLSERSVLISPVRIETSDEECEIVDVVKPRGERTPEIIDLSSDEEPAVVNVSSGEENNSNGGANFDFFTNNYSPDYSPDSPISPFFSLGSPSPWSPRESSSDIECVYESKQPSSSLQEASKDSDVDSSPINICPVDLSGKKDTSSNAEEKSLRQSVVIIPTTSESTKDQSSVEEEIDVDVNSSDSEKTTIIDVVSDIKPNSSPEPVQSSEKPTVPSVIVDPKSLDTTENNHSFWKTRKVQTQCNISSTDSDTDIEMNQSTKKKKLKLRSVVAHFSFDNSDERQSSSHRSSTHKKHKDKKKKKKHAPKHRHRIYSDSDSTS